MLVGKLKPSTSKRANKKPQKSAKLMAQNARYDKNIDWRIEMKRNRRRRALVGGEALAMLTSEK